MQRKGSFFQSLLTLRLRSSYSLAVFLINAVKVSEVLAKNLYQMAYSCREVFRVQWVSSLNTLEDGLHVGL